MATEAICVYDAKNWTLFIASSALDTRCALGLYGLVAESCDDETVECPKCPAGKKPPDCNTGRCCQHVQNFAQRTPLAAPGILLSFFSLYSTECDSGYYGENCWYPCGQCVEVTCNAFTGQCACQAWWVGDTCKQYIGRFYNRSSQH